MWWHKACLLGCVNLLAIINSFASCPQPSQIYRTCMYDYDPRTCSWYANNPGWLGYTVGIYRGDTEVTTFTQAAWWNYAGDKQDGTTFCWYKGNKGSTIRMTQGNWGGVPMPSDVVVWKPGVADGRPMWICTAGVSACSFVYTGQ